LRVSGVGAVSDHAGDSEPSITHAIPAFQRRLTCEARGNPQYASADEDWFLRVVIIDTGLNGENRQVRNRLVAS
jgi:hypothetical protein